MIDGGQLAFAILRLYSALIAIYQSEFALLEARALTLHRRGVLIGKFFARQNLGFRDGLLGMRCNARKSFNLQPGGSVW
jgi:hypothetical protein